MIADPLANLLPRLEQVTRKRTGGYMARCPGHDDQRASLSIRVAENGNLLLHCFAGCTGEHLLAKIGLTYVDLYPPTKQAQRSGVDERRTLVKKTRYPIPGPANPVAIHVRLDYADGSKRFVWELPDGRTGLGGEPVTGLPLYGSDRLTEVTRRVVIVEGEKACDALRALIIDYPTTAVVATVTGASAVPDYEALVTLIGRDDYLLWPDNDPSGENHAGDRRPVA